MAAVDAGEPDITVTQDATDIAVEDTLQDTAVADVAPAKPPLTWNVMVYMAADNNLERSGIDDIKEFCTLDTCDPAKGCVHANTIEYCTDGKACTKGDQCGGGKCVPGPLLECDDGKDCTDDGCDDKTGKCAAPTSPDGAGCGTNKACETGVCTPQCGSKATSCSDGTACTSGDACVSGVCTGTPVNCDDSKQCTADSCDVRDGCKNVVIDEGGACDDGNKCNESICDKDGKCNAGAKAKDCDDKAACTVDSCSTSKGCVNEPTPLSTGAVVWKPLALTGDGVTDDGNINVADDGSIYAGNGQGKYWDIVASKVVLDTGTQAKLAWKKDGRRSIVIPHAGKVYAFTTEVDETNLHFVEVDDTDGVSVTMLWKSPTAGVKRARFDKNGDLWTIDDIAIDKDGNIYAAGSGILEIDVGGGTTSKPKAGVTAKFPNAFLASYDATGKLRWVRRAQAQTDGDFAWGERVAIDPDGDVWWAGIYNGAHSFKTITPSAKGGHFLEKVSAADGTPLQLTYSEATGLNDKSINNEHVGDLRVDKDGRVFITAKTYNVGTFPGGKQIAKKGWWDNWVGRFDGTDWNWLASGGSTGSKEADAAEGGAPDGQGGLVLVGATGGVNAPIEFGSLNYSRAQYQVAVAAHVDKNGQWDWAVGAEGDAQSLFVGVVRDSEGSYIIAGHYGEGAATFGGTTLTNSVSGKRATVVARIDSTGKWLWAVTTASNDTQARTVGITAADRIWIAGQLGADTTFGTTTLKKADTLGFAASLDLTGKWLDALGAMAGSQTVPRSVAFDDAATPIFGGRMYQSATLGGTAHTTRRHVQEMRRRQPDV